MKNAKNMLILSGNGRGISGFKWGQGGKSAIHKIVGQVLSNSRPDPHKSREFVRSQEELVFILQLRPFPVHVSLYEFDIVVPGFFKVRSEYFQQPVSGQEGSRFAQSSGGTITAPFPFFWMFDQSGTPWVQNDVPAAVEQIGFSLNNIGLVATLEDMSNAVVFPVEELAVDLVQVFHALGQVRVGGFDHQVVMVSHKAIGVTQPVEPFGSGVEDVEVLDPVSLIEEDHHPLITPAYDMVKSALERDP